MPTDNKWSKPTPPLKTNLTSATRPISMTREQQYLLYTAAKDAALEGNRELTEYYRSQGVPLYCISRAVGMSGNREYARFLLQENPKSQQLPTSLAIGFKIKGDFKFVNELINSYGANPDAIKNILAPLPPVVHRLSKAKSLDSTKKIIDQIPSAIKTEQPKGPRLRYLTNTFFRGNMTSFSVEKELPHAIGIMTPTLPTTQKTDNPRSIFAESSSENELYVGFVPQN